MSHPAQQSPQLSAALLLALRNFVTLRAELDCAAEAHLEAVAASQHSAAAEQRADLYLATCEKREADAFAVLANALRAHDAQAVPEYLELDGVRFPLAIELASAARQAEHRRTQRAAGHTPLRLVTAEG